MTFLSQLAVDTKALTARMRVGALDPAEMRKAVTKLEKREAVPEQLAEEVGKLQLRVIEYAESDTLGHLTRKDLRESCKVVLHPPRPLATHAEAIDGLLHQVNLTKRRAPFFALIDAYLDGFDRESASVHMLAKKLEGMAAGWPWRPNDQWPTRLEGFALLDPARAPELIARRILTARKRPREILGEAGLDTAGRRFGGLVEAAFAAACRVVMDQRGQEAIESQRVLTEWARDEAGKFGYPKSWSEFVKASLLPWEMTDPSEAHKSSLMEVLQHFGGGDPRSPSTQQRWREIKDNAANVYAVLMRWLTRASVLQFLDIVDRLMPDHEAKQMWAYRRAFWMSYLLSDGQSPGIDAAWVAFGDEGARLALRAARESGEKSFAAFGRQNDKSAVHAALILQMGDLTIVDWSHSAKYQVWKRGDKNPPELFRKIYRAGALYDAPIDGSHSSPKTYFWQKNLAQIIEGRPIFSPKAAWKPRRV